MDYISAIKQAVANKKRRDYPTASDTRSCNGNLFPDHKPKFKVRFSPDQTVFTIGSCFARNIEEALFDRNVFFPTRTFSVPFSEFPFRPNGLLNEYNPGTMSQRILFAIQGREYPEETIVPSGDLFADLLLVGGNDVTLGRAKERRSQINAVYSYLIKSNVVIITLGLVEAWYDEETKLFLNRKPPDAFGRKYSNRFTFKQLDVYDCMPLLEEAITALTQLGVKTIITVSPVPSLATLTINDCVVSNEFSKSVLRVCAGRLARSDLVDYFPSYEIVRSGGLAGYVDDQVHVKDELVRQITKFMVSLYEE